jgi:hypothetical protein
MSFYRNTYVKQNVLLVLLAVVLNWIMATHAFALQFSSRGDVVFLSGPIETGDEYRFRSFLLSHPQAKYAELNSTGGKIRAAGEIGRQIRAGHLTTVINATRAKCLSACTIIFASGVQRFYVGAESLHDSLVPVKEGYGLGYHQGSTTLPGGMKVPSARATDDMLSYLYAFGAWRARSLVMRADTKHYYCISSETAMSKGLATSAGPL